jgi:putative DNA primase/helicase
MPSVDTQEQFLIATACIQRGWPVFPVDVITTPNGTRKQPTVRWKTEATTDPVTVQGWWAANPFAHVGVPTGAVSGLYVLDEDAPGAADFLLADLVVPMQSSPTRREGGRHVYFTGSEPLRNRVDSERHLDFRGDGGFVVMWHGPPAGSLPPVPQVVADWVKAGQREPADLLPYDGDPAPAWGETVLRRAVQDVEQAPEGGRNHTLFRVACEVLRAVNGGHLNTTAATWELMNAAARAGLDDRETARTIDSAGEATVGQASGPPAEIPPREVVDRMMHGVPSIREERHLTDAGNAQRLVDRHGGDVRYVIGWRQWVVWDGTRWREDSPGQIVELAKDTARSIYAEAGACADPNRCEALGKWAHASQSARALEAMVKLARTEAGVPVSADQLDSDVWLLNCANGTVDLRTGELRPADRDDLITKTTGIDYDPTATCPEWEDFVLWAMAGRKDLVEFLRRALGYSLTGDVSERMVFFLHGNGRNGKSTLLKTFRHAVGEYGMRVESSTFEKPVRGRGGGTASPHVAQLKGARFVTTSELEDGTELAAAMLKDVTGDETVSARQLYRDPIEFMPEFKPWIAANHKPRVDADDQAIWDRLKLVPFDARVPESETDRLLPERLRAEAPGILAWSVRGCLDWQSSGLLLPQAVVDASQEYREEMDNFSNFLEWIDELSMRADMGGVPPLDTSPSGLRNTYNEWARHEDLPRLNPTEFKTRMAQHHWRVKTARGVRTWTFDGVRRPVNYAALAREAEVMGNEAPVG